MCRSLLILSFYVLCFTQFPELQTSCRSLIEREQRQHFSNNGSENCHHSYLYHSTAALWSAHVALERRVRGIALNTVWEGWGGTFE